MTKSQAYEALSALLTSHTERPFCKTLACPGCEFPHIRPELEALRERFGAEAFETAAFELLWNAESQVRPEARAQRRGLFYVAVMAPDFLPRPVLAVLHVREIAAHQRRARGGSPALLLHILWILPCWPSVCERVARGELALHDIPKTLIQHMRKTAQENFQRMPQEMKA